MHRDNVIAGVVGVSLVLLILGGGVSYAIWKNKHQASRNQQKTANTETTQEDSSSLLSIDNQAGVALGANTNGGLQTNIGQQKGSNGSSSTPSSNSFKEFDKYKDVENALISEIEAGTGETAEGNKKAAIYYKGWLTNGKLFDESKPEKTGERVQPLTFQFGGRNIIIGLEQGVYGMKVGGKRRIIVPPKVGYGERGYGPIPANAVLVFDVELLAVE